MLGYFDSHAHYNDNKFDSDRDLLLNKLNKEGIEYIMNVSYDMPSSYQTAKIAEKYDFVFGAVGIHPHDAKTASPKAYDELRNLAKSEKIKAIGESGLDYYRNLSPKDIQKKEFANHIELSLELKLPIIIHVRDATKDTFDIINAYNAGGVFHCFSQSLETARIVLNKGYYISLAGPVTYNNSAKLKEVAKFVPSDRLLIETDCPYLSPVPKRGLRNDSSNLKYIAKEIASLKGVTVDKIIKTTNENARCLFKI